MISIAVIIALTLLKDKRLPNDATFGSVSVYATLFGVTDTHSANPATSKCAWILFGSLLDMDWSDLPRLGILIAMGLVILKRIWQSQVKLATSLKHFAQIQGINPLHQHLFLWGFWRDFVLWHFRRLAVY